MDKQQHLGGEQTLAGIRIPMKLPQPYLTLDFFASVGHHAIWDYCSNGAKSDQREIDVYV